MDVLAKDDEAKSRSAEHKYVTGCEQNHLQLNVKKTRELVVDLRKIKVPFSIQRVTVDIVDDHKNSSVHSISELHGVKNTSGLYRKGHFLRCPGCFMGLG